MKKESVLNPDEHRLPRIVPEELAKRERISKTKRDISKALKKAGEDNCVSVEEQTQALHEVFSNMLYHIIKKNRK